MPEVKRQGQTSHTNKPWGGFSQFTLNEPTTVKILEVAKGKRFSLQTHKNRSELWVPLNDGGVATVGEEDFEARAGEEIFIPAGAKHRFFGKDADVKILEIAFGQFDEADIERLEDDFGRVN
ncbi:MAG: mannose-6-phosphate isomerase [Candidatus Buchananbacteria bacterium CG10_big_fil_rev_8_21_14_0_10_42_9]|uniref:Mannose-6-phosphate isomerase n=1 Tax=Candidatus Buchananbacteria bacterium CG10_big_fil_rev_8_21_14_0_10_42_9 TaxID=1974526 RepID=A0A2H0W0M4_9BACT|nr:MAG: mannose-6-phosphate isomerase [Candidatus Buchananbacteria bacterium CG10_big_fil_rev_8_21_14_0_10_42_9]